MREKFEKLKKDGKVSSLFFRFLLCETKIILIFNQIIISWINTWRKSASTMHKEIESRCQLKKNFERIQFNLLT
jgi:hypothetical protein